SCPRQAVQVESGYIVALTNSSLLTAASAFQSDSFVRLNRNRQVSFDKGILPTLSDVLYFSRPVWLVHTVKGDSTVRNKSKIFVQLPALRREVPWRPQIIEAA